jgi:Predicted DNA-binding proteins
MTELTVVPLKDEEWEAILLTDYNGLDHEAAAANMGISRPTFSRVLASARRAVAKALAEGSALQIGGGNFELRGCLETQANHQKTKPEPARG